MLPLQRAKKNVDKYCISIDGQERNGSKKKKNKSESEGREMKN